MYVTCLPHVIFMHCLIIVRYSGKILKQNLFVLYVVVANEHWPLLLLQVSSRT